MMGIISVAVQMLTSQFTFGTTVSNIDENAMQDRKDVVKNVNWTVYGENLQSKMKFISDHVRPSLFSFWSEVRVTGGNLPISPVIAPFRTYL